MPVLHQIENRFRHSASRTFVAYADTHLEWSDSAAGGLEAHLVPGEHLRMREEPNGRVLAEKLKQCIVKAQSDGLTNADLWSRIAELKTARRSSTRILQSAIVHVNYVNNAGSSDRPAGTPSSD